jgi:hypothetical protein
MSHDSSPAFSAFGTSDTVSSLAAEISSSGSSSGSCAVAPPRLMSEAIASASSLMNAASRRSGSPFGSGVGTATRSEVDFTVAPGSSPCPTSKARRKRGSVRRRSLDLRNLDAGLHFDGDRRD